jgi:hypothetical protein
MKKFYLLLCLGFLTMKSFGQLVYEPFNYTAHATQGLAAQSSSVWLIVNTGDSILVNAGSLSYSGLPASTGNKVKFDGAGTDYYRVFAPQTSGKVYYSFILNLSSLGSLDATGGYFTTLMQTGSTTAFGASIWTRLSATAGKYNVGISTRSNSAVAWVATDLDPNTSYFVVGDYEIVAGATNDISKIWLNPALGGAEPAASATAAAGTDLTAAGVERVLLRQDSDPETAFTEMDELRVGTTWADVTPGGVAPSLSATTLTGFGNVCINTSAGPNSFTITGANLTNANVTVGALPGFTYSTTSGGTYTTTLSLGQPGGAYSQQIFVRFDPTAVQSYNGNIPVGGGGATSINVAATGAGVNSIPTVTSGAASSVTQTTATVAGSIPSIGCSAITSNYGVEWSTTNGFPNGTGTAVLATNLTGGNFSSNLSGLAPATTYYYHAFATNAAGTGYGAQGSFTTVSPNPTITTTALTAFGSICINTTAGPNSFTINGTNLTNANVTVGALAGFTYSTTAAGTYTTTLSLTQPGGTYSQQIFVRFSPTAVQSYNGNIPVAGGGVAATVNVAASGAGVSTAPTVTTGAASAITQTTATAAGSIPNTGCTAITAYGIEYSTTNGFPNGSGTQTASTNLAAGSFTSALSGLAPATTYYYKAYATNAGGTSYGAQQSFTTVAPTLSATALTAFGAVCTNTTTNANSFTITGVGLTTANVNVGALAGYAYSTTSGGTYTSTLSIAQPGGAFSQQVFVKFTPTAVQLYNGNIPVSGGGSIGTINVAASGSGVNTAPSVTTGTVASADNHSAVLNGSIANSGCSNVTAYGIEYSGVNGFLDGNGTKVPSTNLAAGNFSSTLTGLVQGATYYYKAYATNAGGTSYGTQQSFTVPSIETGFHLYPSPVERGGTLRITVDNLTPGYYGLLLYDSQGRLVFQKNINIQANFINQTFSIPGHLQTGIYQAQLVNFEKKLSVLTIMIQ